MTRLRLHKETHAASRVGWLRAAVLGANDGIVSTASLIVGVAAAAASQSEVLVAGFAGLVAGAMSMAAGEYVSVSSQADSERADLARETEELRDQPEFEKAELCAIYEGRGLSPELARQVTEQLMARDALGVHAREELGITDMTTARPLQAAFTSAATFAVGAGAPLLLAALLPLPWQIAGVSAGALLLLAVLGALGALAGGAPIVRPTLRVVFWGAAALALTAGIGRLVGAAV